MLTNRTSLSAADKSFCMSTVLGSIISAAFIQFASYRWIFFLVTVLAIPSAALCMSMIPPGNSETTSPSSLRNRLGMHMEKIRRLDPVGVSLFTGQSSPDFILLFGADTVLLCIHM